MTRVSVINKPRRIKKVRQGICTKKFVVKVKQGDKVKNNQIRRRKTWRSEKTIHKLKNFRSRHNCDTAKDKMSARYWSCRNW